MIMEKVFAEAAIIINSNIYRVGVIVYSYFVDNYVSYIIYYIIN